LSESVTLEQGASRQAAPSAPSYARRILPEANTGAPHCGAPALAPAAPAGGPVVLYDGVCGLCDRFVQLVLARDRRGQFRFAPLQGPFAAAVLARHGITSAGDPDTIVLVENPGTAAERLRFRSDAALTVLAGLGGAWRLTGLLHAIPRFARDAVYDLVARVRYRVFGRLDVCRVPPLGAGPPERFIE
jgi:predicted DCC family thiol-disulfide oxidoreductase YuxK